MVLRRLVLILGIASACAIVAATATYLLLMRAEALIGAQPMVNEEVATWQREAWVTGGLSGLATALVIALTLVIGANLRAEARLRGEVSELEARWRFALEGAEHGVFDWQLVNNRFYRSPRYLEMVGYGEADLDASEPTVEKVVDSGDRERIRQLWSDCRAGRYTRFSEEFRLLRKDGTTLDALLSGTVVDRDANGQPARLIGTLTDVTRLKAAEARVSEGQRRLDAIMQTAMDAIIAVDAAQRVVVFNSAAERMFGCSAEQAVGAPLDRFIPERFRAAHRDHVDRFGRTGETSRRMGRQTALWALRSDGTEFPIEASISHAAVRGERLFTVILRDVSQRLEVEQEIQNSHEQLRALSAQMSEVRELERTRIARELHDELGQALTALKMDIDLLENELLLSRTDLRERIAAMRGLLDFTVATTRRISSDLRPLVLDDLGLAAAADWLVQNIARRSNLDCDLEVDSDCAQLGEPHASVVFRIMQEALTNVARHARATRVEIALAREGDWVVLTVRDNGVGIDAVGQRKPQSFGLRGIRERALSLGGEIAIVGEPGAGTTLAARIPLHDTSSRVAA